MFDSSGKARCLGSSQTRATDDARLIERIARHHYVS